MSASLPPNPTPPSSSSSSSASTPATNYALDLTLCNQELPPGLKAGSGFFKALIQVILAEKEQRRLKKEKLEKEQEGVEKNREAIARLSHEIKGIGDDLTRLDVIMKSHKDPKIKSFSENFNQEMFLGTFIAKNILAAKDGERSREILEDLYSKETWIQDIFKSSQSMVETFKNSYDSIVLRNFLASFTDKELKKFDPELHALCQAAPRSQLASNDMASSSSGSSSSSGHWDSNAVIQGADRLEINLKYSYQETPRKIYNTKENKEQVKIEIARKLEIHDNGVGKSIIDVMKKNHDETRQSSSNTVTDCYTYGGRFTTHWLRTGGAGKGAKLIAKGLEDKEVARGDRKNTLGYLETRTKTLLLDERPPYIHLTEQEKEDAFIGSIMRHGRRQEEVGVLSERVSLMMLSPKGQQFSKKEDVSNNNPMTDKISNNNSNQAATSSSSKTQPLTLNVGGDEGSIEGSPLAIDLGSDADSDEGGYESDGSKMKKRR